MFVTSRECRDVNAKEAQSCILGYTVGCGRRGLNGTGSPLTGRDHSLVGWI